MGVNYLSVSTRIVAEGSAFSVYEILSGDRSHVEDFFHELPMDTRRRVVRLIEFIADHGTPSSQQKFRHEEDGIYAIKQGQARIYCFFDAGRVILLTHGTIKKKEKADPEDLKRAKRLRKAYLTAKRLH